jgi:hypothetical protein
MVSVVDAELLAALSVSPLYVAVMLWLPGVSELVVRELAPLESGWELNTLPPSLKVTEPVIGGPLLLVTVAVKVMGKPTVLLLAVVANAVAVFALVICSLTVFEVPLTFALSPAYWAERV